MNKFFLRLNPDKTKILVICRTLLKTKIFINGTFINGKCVRFVLDAKNLGIMLDNELSFEPQIKKLTSSCFMTTQNFQNKELPQTRASKALVSAIILSKIDYCNALYLGLNADLVMKIQSVQNSAVRLVCNINRYEKLSITNLTKTLHWLRVKDSDI